MSGTTRPQVGVRLHTWFGRKILGDNCSISTVNRMGLHKRRDEMKTSKHWSQAGSQTTFVVGNQQIIPGKVKSSQTNIPPPHRHVAPLMLLAEKCEQTRWLIWDVFEWDKRPTANCKPGLLERDVNPKSQIPQITKWRRISNSTKIMKRTLSRLLYEIVIRYNNATKLNMGMKSTGH